MDALMLLREITEIIAAEVDRPPVLPSLPARDDLHAAAGQQAELHEREGVRKAVPRAQLRKRPFRRALLPRQRLDRQPELRAAIRLQQPHQKMQRIAPPAADSMSDSLHELAVASLEIAQILAPDIAGREVDVVAKEAHNVPRSSVSCGIAQQMRLWNTKPRASQSILS